MTIFTLLWAQGLPKNASFWDRQEPWGSINVKHCVPTPLVFTETCSVPYINATLMQFLTSGPNGWVLTVKYLKFYGKVDENLKEKILIKHWLKNLFFRREIDFDKNLSCVWEDRVLPPHTHTLGWEHRQFQQCFLVAEGFIEHFHACSQLRCNESLSDRPLPCCWRETQAGTPATVWVVQPWSVTQMSPLLQLWAEQEQRKCSHGARHGVSANYRHTSTAEVFPACKIPTRNHLKVYSP